MTKYLWGSIFFVPTTWDGDDDTLDETVIESHPRQVSSFGKAKALWRIVGRDDKAAIIDRVLARVCAEERGEILREEDLVELEGAFAGLKDALVAYSPDWAATLSDARAAELRAKYPALDLEDVQGFITHHSLLASFAEADELRRLLRDARERGLNVLIDFGR